MIIDMGKRDAKDNVSVRIEPELLEALDTLAEREQRTRSWLINDAVREYLESRGLVKARKGGKS